MLGYFFVHFTQSGHRSPSPAKFLFEMRERWTKVIKATGGRPFNCLFCAFNTTNADSLATHASSCRKKRKLQDDAVAAAAEARAAGKLMHDEHGRILCGRQATTTSVKNVLGLESCSCARSVIPRDICVALRTP
jgi:hypothetical protein